LLRHIWLALACAWACACAESTPDNAVSETIAVLDGTGREVRLSVPAQRVVSLLPTVTDLLIAMRAHDRLIARTDFDTDQRVADLPSLGGGLTPSIEWLASQRPDLVISWPDQGSRSLVAQLGSINIPVYAASTQSIDDTYQILDNIGVLLGIGSRTDSLRKAIESGLDSVRTATRERAVVKVVYVVGVDPPMVAAAGSFIDELITIAGGRNIFGDLKLWPQVNLEDVLQRDPDVIILADTNTDDPVTALQRLAGWRQLRAVRNGRVFRVSPYFFNRSGPLMPRAAAELAAFFHGR
jgi:iron complex transport system substrate-binding protein